MSNESEKKPREYPTDPRGGLFVDFDDGRCRIHESDMTASDRKLAGLPPVPAAQDSTPADTEDMIDA